MPHARAAQNGCGLHDRFADSIVKTERDILYRILPLFAFFALLLNLSVALHAQVSSSAAITGTVTDSTGAVVPNAKVTATNEGTKAQIVRTTNQSGAYDFPSLPVGTYTVTVTSPGFATFSVQDMTLHPATTTTVNAVLRAGDVQSQVLVTATAAQVELATPEVSNDVSGSQVETLPLNGRNYQALSVVMPGVQNTSAGTSLGTGGRSTNNVISINGSLSNTTVYYLDGIWNENTGNMGQTTIMPNPDSLEEVRVLQNSYSVRYGFLGASVVLLQTRAGTSQFHGRAWEYLRNDALNARNYFSTYVPTLKQNLFGYNLGGPLYIPKLYNTNRDKTHFFWNEQWAIIHSQNTLTGNTPTDLQRSGRFTNEIKNPATGKDFPQDSNGYYNISSALNASAVAYLNALYPKPNYSKTGSSANYINNKPMVIDQRDDEIKVDHYITPNHHLTGEFLDEYQDYRQNSFNSANSGEVFDVNWEEDYTHNKVMGLSLTSMLTNDIVNTLSLTSNIFDLDLDLKGIYDVSSLSGYSSTMPYAGYLSNRIPLVTISGTNNMSPQGVPAARPLKHAADLDDMVADDISWQHGRHLIQGGINIMFNTKRQNVGTATNGQWTFTGSSSGSGLADFMLGYAATFTQVSNQRRIPVHATVISPYVEDRYKLLKNVIVTAGVRVTHLPLPHPSTGEVTSFLASAYSASQAPTINTTGVITSTSYNGTNGLITNGVNGVADNFFNNHNWYFGPNVGFAWDVLGNGRYSVRGGYGLNYTRIFTNQDCSFSCVSNPPYLSSTNLTGVTFGQATTSGKAKSATIQTLNGADPQIQATQVHSFNLSFEGDLGHNWLVSVTGASSQIRHLVGNWNYNQPAHYGNYDFNPAINNDKVTPYYYSPYQGYSSITTFATRQGLNWNAFEASLKHPVSNSVYFTLAYTWSHNLSNYTSATTFNVIDPYNPSRYYGNTPGYDYRHTASATLMYKLPFFKNGNMLKRTLLGGWRYSDITTLRTGTATDPTLSISNQGLAVHPDLVTGQKITGPKTASAWFNASAFASPKAGYYGNAPIGAITGPGLVVFDMAIYKDFPLVGEHSLQFRGESFNVFNHTNFNAIGSVLGKSNFGQVTSARDPRIFEVVLRYQF